VGSAVGNGGTALSISSQNTSGVASGTLGVGTSGVARGRSGTSGKSTGSADVVGDKVTSSALGALDVGSVGVASSFKTDTSEAGSGEGTAALGGGIEEEARGTLGALSLGALTSGSAVSFNAVGGEGTTVVGPIAPSSTSGSASSRGTSEGRRGNSNEAENESKD